MEDRIKVFNAEIDSKLGCIVHLNVDEPIMIGDKLLLLVDEKEHYFEVINIKTSLVAQFVVTAKSTGYYTKIDGRKFFDIRVLLGKNLSLIRDKELIAKIEKESRYC
jgi:hypothetical protein